MYRIIAAFFLLVASVATSSPQPALFPSVWQNQNGSILKVLATGPAGNFNGVFINYGPPRPGAGYYLARGHARPLDPIPGLEGMVARLQVGHSVARPHDRPDHGRGEVGHDLRRPERGRGGYVPAPLTNPGARRLAARPAHIPAA